MRIKLDELTIKYRAKERSKIIQLMALETIKIKLNRWKAFQRAAQPEQATQDPISKCSYLQHTHSNRAKIDEIYNAIAKVETQRNEIEALLDDPITFSKLSGAIGQIEDLIRFSLGDFGSGIGAARKDFIGLLLQHLEEKRAELEGGKEITARNTNVYEESTNLNQGS